jgi:protease-4
MYNSEEDAQINVGQSKPRYYEKPGQTTGYLKQKWFAFGCLSAIIILFIIAIVSISSLMILGRRKPAQVKTGTYLTLQLSGAIEEHKELDQDMFSLSKTLSARDIVNRINIAKDDPNISGIILEPRFLAAGYATLNEIIDALSRFKESGKPVYAYLDLAANRDYYLVSAADKIYLNPSASSGIYLSGVGISSLYMKDMLNKLGVEMTVVHAGDYKGAGETLTRMNMSPQFRESVTDLLDDLYLQLLEDVAQRRNLSFDHIREVYETRRDLLINQDYALDMNIVDQLASREMMLNSLGIEDNRLMKIENYQSKPSLPKVHHKVAVVYLQGSISVPTDSFTQQSINSRKFANIVKTIDKDPAIAAIVLRINSPGGAALESDKIYHQITKLNTTKPIVISMSDVAASGGYYIAAPGDYIFADPYTITGSIGVVAMIPNLYNTGQKIGINPQTIYRGKYSNFMNIWEKPNPADIIALQRSLDSTYDEFKQRVVDGRGMTQTNVERVAKGRIWSSKSALENGLIDEIGTLDRAVEKAAELAGLPDYRTVYLPETQTFFDLIMEKRFGINVFQDLVRSSISIDERLEYTEQLYRSIKNEPIQMLSPVIFVD